MGVVWNMAVFIGFGFFFFRLFVSFFCVCCWSFDGWVEFVILVSLRELFLGRGFCLGVLRGVVYGYCLFRYFVLKGVGGS